MVPGVNEHQCHVNHANHVNTCIESGVLGRKEWVESPYSDTCPRLQQAFILWRGQCMYEDGQHWILHVVVTLPAKRPTVDVTAHSSGGWPSHSFMHSEHFTICL